MGMGWMGMELGIAPRLLQPRRLGRMGKSLSSAERLVPTSTGCVYQSPRLWRQLALSPAELSPACSATTSTQSSAVGTEQPAGAQTTHGWSSAGAAS